MPSSKRFAFIGQQVSRQATLLSYIDMFAMSERWRSTDGDRPDPAAYPAPRRRSTIRPPLNFHVLSDRVCHRRSE